MIGALMSLDICVKLTILMLHRVESTYRAASRTAFAVDEDVTFWREVSHAVLRDSAVATYDSLNEFRFNRSLRPSSPTT